MRNKVKVHQNWKLVLLDRVAKRGSGHTPNKSIPAYWNGGIKWISLADSNKLDRIHINSTKYEISKEGIKNSSAVLHPLGIVVLSRDAGVGKSAITTCEMAVSQHFITWQCGPELHNYFLYYWLQFMKPVFEKIAIGSTIKTIGLPFFQQLEIPLPPLSVQREIAKVLLCWDSSIDQLEHLLKAKLRLKHGLMQQLLTGKKRFPEFQEQEWLKVSAGDLFKNVSIKGNKNEELLSATQDKGIIPRSMLEARVTMPTGDTNSFKLVEAGDFVISLRSFQGGLEYSYYRGIVSPAYTVLKPKKQISAEFYKQYYKSYEFIGRLATAVIGIRDGKQVSYEDYCLVKIPFPSIEEQERIAQVLNACDKEIELLKQQLNALKRQKRGLMQKLLKGQIPVKVDDIEATTVEAG